MKILIISNMYPPQSLGGYELLCKSAVDGLILRGHEVKVLTSTFGLKHPEIKGNILRILALETDCYQPKKNSFLSETFKELKNIRHLRKTIIDFSPDIIYIWNMGNLARSIIQEAQLYEPDIITVFYLSDDWLLHKELHHWLNIKSKSNLLWFLKQKSRSLLRKIPQFRDDEISFSYVSFVSESLKLQHIKYGLQVQNAKIIYNCVPVEKFVKHFQNYCESFKSRAVVKFLYLGQLVEHKGVHTALEAFGYLSRNPKFKENALMTIAGPGQKDYLLKLKNISIKYNIQSQVLFHNAVSREEVIQLLHSHNILVFPSIWEEPFSVVLMEAMASGMAVAGTLVGGNAEILKNKVNAITFEANNVNDCARAMNLLFNDDTLRIKLGENAAALIKKNFYEKKMIDEIENFLFEIYEKTKTFKISKLH